MYGRGRRRPRFSLLQLDYNESFFIDLGCILDVEEPAGQKLGLRGARRLKGRLKVGSWSLTFDPEDPDIGPVPPCAAAANYTDAEVHAQVSERLASLPRPGSLTDDLALAESLVGAGAAPLTSLAEPSVLPTGKLAGAPNALKRVAQQIVYAFASGVPYPLLGGRNATADEMYRLLAWQHWARAFAR